MTASAQVVTLDAKSVIKTATIERITMNLEDRIALHHRMAEGYRNSYLRQGVQDGEKYEAWKFSKDAVYSSPYFTGDQVNKISDVSVSVATYATMEAKAYSLTFPDWKPVDWKCWAADNGFVMKTRWEGHTKTGKKMGFYSYSFIETNDAGEVTRWETHVNEEYSDFLQVAIGVRGPFLGNHAPYLEALTRVLKEAGVSV